MPRVWLGKGPLHNYYLSTILEIHLKLVVNYVATHTFKRFIDYAIH